ncbi:GntR family transcriptional regulator [Glacieibacterium sp.]|uniref:GntR family transcriptional regulator n=1 Tax=Glacieibacterium sp. TaxID=2860237 RepID=UPI003AFF7E1F
MSANPALSIDPQSSVPTPYRSGEPRKGWLHQEAVALLRKLILSGELSPGERLREVVISQQFGMSRTPVREAFRTLAAEGLIDLLPNRSVIVSELDRTEVTDVFSVLSALEGLAGQQACLRMSEEQLAKLERKQRQLEASFAAADRPAYTRINRRIHELMVEGSGNASLILAWRLILPRAERGRTVSVLGQRRWAEALDEHRQILAALLDRDPARLATLMQLHFTNSITSLGAYDKSQSQ